MLSVALDIEAATDMPVSCTRDYVGCGPNTHDSAVTVVYRTPWTCCLRAVKTADH